MTYLSRLFRIHLLSSHRLFRLLGRIKSLTEPVYILRKTDRTPC